MAQPSDHQVQIAERLVEVLPSDDLKKNERINVNRRGLFMPFGRHLDLQPEQSRNDLHTENAVEQTGAQDQDLAVATELEPVLLRSVIAALIRKTSAQSQLTLEHQLFELFTQMPLQVMDDNGMPLLLNKPVELSQKEKQQWVAKTVQRLLLDEVYQDIIEIKGEKGRYYYSDRSMSANYAKLSMLVEEKEHCVMIAEVVRFESLTYPRPYSVEMLHYAPFFMSDEEIKTALVALKSKPECEDIQEVSASNDAIYLYSHLHMTKAAACGLCEWIEVEQFANP